MDPGKWTRVFPRIDFGDPPPPSPLEIAQNYLLVFYSQLLKRVPVVLCLGALSGPRENPPPPSPPLKKWQNSLILDFNCQPLRRVPFCFMSVGPYGPGGVLSHFEGGGEGSPKCILGKTRYFWLNFMPFCPISHYLLSCYLLPDSQTDDRRASRGVEINLGRERDSNLQVWGSSWLRKR